ncbi:hypothetical protein LTR10_016952 [Elasticomyces elasticus]|uniref:Pre-mRNA-splicing factor SPF27 n=1 Tax=Exophiala sideris TaxID=1016849 RepID=A0ABR0JF94_9EURO|nr:hypothetical protein LTR10_016952 [Elasticomyces elasticus]KAK5025206.1 hypothetical protein LTS07_008057 [Exophiala sideris]KAK5029246.1 hypothetical protein LTR13_008783 [Exophiala sideris]KAK5063265.1 hypothetical protein LTR69_003971 [Exophiala sideris]KAK5178981.1 hypothetical protein LTR44_008470 [Eurotiomycetes sp. CCFEE 6388]
MPLILESHDSLPYIDTDPTDAEKDRARALINQQLPSDYLTTAHPSISSSPKVKSSEEVLQKLELATPGKRDAGGIDPTRYEAPDEPTGESTVEEYRQILRKSYVASTFLENRQTNLELLDEFGKNAWLVGNSQVEQVLQDMESELARVKTETDDINKARKTAQEQHKAELLGLEETWKRGLGQILEIQVATQELRRLIYDRQRQHAGQ